MNAPRPPPGAVARGDFLVARVLRYAIRLPLLVWHLLVHLPLILLLLTPPTRNWRWQGEPFHYAVMRRWQAMLLWIFGMRVRSVGTPASGATLFVANHIGWVDISLLHSQRMMGFVAKDEISRWPVIGWLGARAETIFHRRGSTESLHGVLVEMVARLRAGQSVGVFPEGGTRGGRELGPFHARIFAAAVDANVSVQPVALVYGAHAAAQAIVAFRRGESFVANFFRLLGEPSREVGVHFLAPIDVVQVDGRRRLADLARQRISDAMAAA